MVTRALAHKTSANCSIKLEFYCKMTRITLRSLKSQHWSNAPSMSRTYDLLVFT